MQHTVCSILTGFSRAGFGRPILAGGQAQPQGSSPLLSTAGVRGANNFLVFPHSDNHQGPVKVGGIDPPLPLWMLHWCLCPLSPPDRAVLGAVLPRLWTPRTGAAHSPWSAWRCLWSSSPPRHPSSTHPSPVHYSRAQTPSYISPPGNRGIKVALSWRLVV